MSWRAFHSFHPKRLPWLRESLHITSFHCYHCLKTQRDILLWLCQHLKQLDYLGSDLCEWIDWWLHRVQCTMAFSRIYYLHRQARHGHLCNGNRLMTLCCALQDRCLDIEKAHLMLNQNILHALDHSAVCCANCKTEIHERGSGCHTVFWAERTQALLMGGQCTAWTDTLYPLFGIYLLLAVASDALGSYSVPISVGIWMLEAFFANSIWKRSPIDRSFLLHWECFEIPLACAANQSAGRLVLLVLEIYCWACHEIDCPFV